MTYLEKRTIRVAGGLAVDIGTTTVSASYHRHAGWRDPGQRHPPETDRSVTVRT